MRILIDAHCFDQVAAEGITTYINGIYSQLPDLMPDTEFFFAAESRDSLADLLADRPNTHFVQLPPSGRLDRLVRIFPRLIRELRADWAHFQYIAPINPGCRTIITLHDVLFKDFPDYFPLSYRISRDILFRHSARNADILTTVSEYSRRRIAHHYRIDPERIVITPNAVRRDFFDVNREVAHRRIAALGIRDFILNVSRIEPRKNQVALVRAYRDLNLADKGYDLVLINHESLPVPELERMIAQLPAETRRHIHRFDSKPFDELKYWYAAASLFVYPSIAEGFGIPPLEAAATGTPVICHNDTSMADYDFLGEGLADLREPGRLEALITRALTAPNPQRDRSAVAAIAAEIAKRYNWKRSGGALKLRIETAKLER